VFLALTLNNVSLSVCSPFFLCILLSVVCLLHFSANNI